MASRYRVNRDGPTTGPIPRFQDRTGRNTYGQEIPLGDRMESAPNGGANFGGNGLGAFGPDQSPDVPTPMDAPLTEQLLGEQQPPEGQPPAPRYRPIGGYQTGYQGGFTNEGDPFKQLQQNRMAAKGTGDAINQATVDAQNQYGQREADAANAVERNVSSLEQTPGYTPQEASQINVDYGQFRTSPEDLGKEFLTREEQGQIRGNPYAASRYFNRGALTGMTNEAVGRERAATEGLRSGLNEAIDPEQSNAAVQNQMVRMGSAFGDESGRLKSAIDREKLGLDSDFAARQMTDRDAQDMQDMAGRTVGNRYRSAQEDVARRAAAEGNSSPLAIAAAREQLERDSAADAGDAMTQARIGARQAQFGRARDIEGMRLGTEQDISSRGMQAANELGGRQMQAIEKAGSDELENAQQQQALRLRAAGQGGQADIETAYRTGQQTLDTEQQNQNTEMGLAQRGEQSQQQRDAALAANRQQTQTGVNSTGYQQGMQTSQATSQGAQAVGNARRQGQAQAIDARQKQQGMAQEGGTAARGQQIQNANVTNQGVNEASSQAGRYKLGKASQPGIFDKAVGAAAGAASAFFEDGGVVTDSPSEDSGEKPGFMDKLKAAASRYRVATDKQNNQDGGDRGGSFNPVDTYRDIGKAAGSIGAEFLAGGGVPARKLAVVGERGPEAVVSLADHSQPQIVSTPTLGLFKKGEAVIPMGGHKPGQKVPSSLALTARARYRHPTGPSGPHGPMRTDYPLVPNRVYR